MALPAACLSGQISYLAKISTCRVGVPTFSALVISSSTVVVVFPALVPTISQGIILNNKQVRARATTNTGSDATVVSSTRVRAEDSSDDHVAWVTTVSLRHAVAVRAALEFHAAARAPPASGRARARHTTRRQRVHHRWGSYISTSRQNDPLPRSKYARGFKTCSAGFQTSNIYRLKIKVGWFISRILLARRYICS